MSMARVGDHEEIPEEMKDLLMQWKIEKITNIGYT